MSKMNKKDVWAGLMKGSRVTNVDLTKVEMCKNVLNKFRDR